MFNPQGADKGPYSVAVYVMFGVCGPERRTFLMQNLKKSPIKGIIQHLNFNSSGENNVKL